MPTLKGTEASLSYVQCFLYLVYSLINVSIFHSASLYTFWTEIYNVYNVLMYTVFLRIIMYTVFLRINCRY